MTGGRAMSEPETRARAAVFVGMPGRVHEDQRVSGARDSELQSARRRRRPWSCPPGAKRSTCMTVVNSFTNRIMASWLLVLVGHRARLGRGPAGQC
jgi:hypothetical protein